MPRNRQVHGWTQRFETTVALAGVDPQVGPGVFGLLGPNGAGKTTLLRTLATLIPPASGFLRLRGCDPGEATQRRELRRRLGYVPRALGCLLFPRVPEPVVLALYQMAQKRSNRC
jgi:ABC-type multidrug transport system ATPase subunit